MGETRCVVKVIRWLLHQQEPSVTRKFLLIFEMYLLFPFLCFMHRVQPSFVTLLLLDKIIEKLHKSVLALEHTKCTGTNMDSD